jgi:hypothetical protein
MIRTRLSQVLALGVVLPLVAACSHGDDRKAPSGNAPSDSARPAEVVPKIQFRVQPIIDKQQGGLVLGTITVPQDWKVVSHVEWNYQNVSHPVRATARAEAPDGSAWVEYFPVEMFYWLDPVQSPIPIGGRSLGMIHRPHIDIREAMQRFVIGPYRGKQPKLQIASSRPVHGLAEAFGSPPTPGDALAVRLRYVVGGQPVDEDVYGLLASGNRIPYTGPQGTWYESHRPLVFVHSMGATNGKLDSLHPLLGFIATSLKVDPAWEVHRQQVMQHLAAEFNRLIARGYAQIRAAAELSRSISRNNDAMIASIEGQRQAQAQRDAAARQAANSAPSPNDDFDLYIRGNERMKDPYWGESEQSYNEKYHWTDGQGNYQHSNDSTFNPNIGAGGGPTWQRMEPADR